MDKVLRTSSSLIALAERLGVRRSPGVEEIVDVLDSNTIEVQ